MPPRARRNATARAGLVLAACLGLGGAAGGESASALRVAPLQAWQRIDAVAVRDEPLRIVVEVAPPAAGHASGLAQLAPDAKAAVADAARPERGFAVADRAGVSWWRAGHASRSAFEGVRDIAFDGSGGLWVATEEGLWHWQAGARPRRRPGPGGSPANRVRRLASNGHAVLAATDAGGFLSWAGGPWRALPGPGVGRPVRLVAFVTASSSAPPRVGWIEDDRLWIAALESVGDSTRLGRSRAHRLPRRVAELTPVDLVADPTGQALHVVHPDAVASLRLDRPGSGPGVPGAPEWRVERPVLSPGAGLRSLAWTAAGLWWATEHGVFHGPSLAGPFERAESPLGTARCHDLESDHEDGLLVLCRRAVYRRASTRSPQGPVAGVDRRSSPGTRRDALADPPLALLRARALEHSGLDAERARGWLRGVARRGYWPSLSLRVGADLDRERAWKADQSFVSGDTRSLFDRGRDRGESFFASLALEWELAELAYPLETTDLSRELRQVVSLRDDVADEIHQLYFERQALLERLSSESPLAPTERRALELRAAEIAAGLDAWTDGFLSRWRRERAAREAP